MLAGFCLVCSCCLLVIDDDVFFAFVAGARGVEKLAVLDCRLVESSAVVAVPVVILTGSVYLRSLVFEFRRIEAGFFWNSTRCFGVPSDVRFVEDAVVELRVDCVVLPFGVCVGWVNQVSLSFHGARKRQ